MGGGRWWDKDEKRIELPVYAAAPSEWDRIYKEKITPYNFLLIVAMPNYVKARVVAMKNQTLLNEAMIACALWRYQKQHGSYPENLDALTPEFMPKVPREVVNEQPLKYRRTSEGSYWLYSVGEDGQDDGGPGGKFDAGNTKDWIWEGSLRDGSDR
jgi:hypothetical protein